MAITAERLREVLRYEPDTGEWYWRVRGKGRQINRPAGGIYPSGIEGVLYRRITVDRQDYRAIRLIFLYMTGRWPTNVDHIDGDTINDKWPNLRECTTSQNAANRRVISALNQSGYKGVSFHCLSGKWHASLKVNGKSCNLGYFDRKENAALAYNFAAYEAFGEFARLNRAEG